MEQFNWELPSFLSHPDYYTLEYDLEIPVLGGTTEKLEYLHAPQTGYLVPGDVVGIWDAVSQSFILELVYDDYLCFIPLVNTNEIKYLKEGTKLLKICHILKEI